MSGPSPRKMKKLEQGGDDDLDEIVHQAHLKDLDETQKELDNLSEAASKEILQVEGKYNQLGKPIYAKRATIIERVPNFWVIAVLNHPQISMLIDEEEEDVINFLEKVEVEGFEDIEDGFRIKFVFEENPFFENTELVKELQFGPNFEPKSTSTVIQWKEEMDVTKKIRMRSLDVQTFFSWFGDNTDPASDDIAQVIMNDLWADPLQYYVTPGDDSENGSGEEEEDGDENAVEGVEKDKIEEDKTGSGEEGKEGGKNGEGNAVETDEDPSEEEEKGQ